MTTIGAHGFYFVGFSVLVDGHKVALFTRLITYLALVSVCVWGLVVVSTLLCVLAQHIYKYKVRAYMRRRLATEAE